MASHHGSTHRRSRSAFVVVVLLLTLALATGLAFQAHRAARAQRATAESALRKYAEFGSWEFSERVRNEFNRLLGTGLGLALERDSAGNIALLPPGARLPTSPARQRTYQALGTLVRFNFTVEPNRDVLVLGARPDPAVLGWIRDSLRWSDRDSTTVDWEYWATIRRFGDTRHLLVFTFIRPMRDGYGAPRQLLGFGGDADSLRPVLERLFAGDTLVRGSLTGGLRNEAWLYVRVTDPTGGELFRSDSTMWPAITSRDTLQPKYAGLMIDAAVHPAAVDRLVAGGVPPSRFPMLVGIVALTAALVAAAMLQLRREHELARIRTEFVSGVSHELRTPLAQIRMFTETLLLDRVRSGEERRRSVEIIDREARRLTHLVENVLHFSRAETRRTRLAPQRVELGSLVRETIETFAPLAAARKIEVRTEIGDGMVAAIDRGAFQQVVLNLLDNAVKFGPPGQTVTVSLAGAAGHVWLTVDDEGPGIPPADRERVWEPFCRLEREERRAVAGTGIGLAVVRELVLQHGGRVSVGASPAGGARFRIELPALARAELMVASPV